MSEKEKAQKPPEKKPRFVKVYFNNGNTAVYPLDKVLFYNTLPARIEPGTIAVNWAAVSWFREYEEVLD